MGRSQVPWLIDSVHNIRENMLSLVKGEIGRNINNEPMVGWTYLLTFFHFPATLQAPKGTDPILFHRRSHTGRQCGKSRAEVSWISFLPYFKNRQSLTAPSVFDFWHQVEFWSREQHKTVFETWESIDGRYGRWEDCVILNTTSVGSRFLDLKNNIAQQSMKMKKYYIWIKRIFLTPRQFFFLPGKNTRIVITN